MRCTFNELLDSDGPTPVLVKGQEQLLPFMPVQYTVGWVDIGIRTTVRLGKVLFVAKVCKIYLKTFLVHWPLPHRCTLWGPCSTYGSKMIFFHNIGFMGIKRRRILRRFQKYKLVLVTKCTQNEQIKILLHRRPPCVVKQKLYPGFNHSRGILSLIQVYIF
jgi:hypothetical protein